MPKSRIVITCAKGIAPLLSEEILRLEFPVLSEGISAVETEGTLEDAMKLNLYIRTGQRVLFLISEFKARDPDELYRKVLGIAWEQYLSEDGYFSVTSAVDTTTIRDSRYASLKCKDAIVDRLKDLLGRRPDSGRERSHAVVHLHWVKGRSHLFLDTSGEPLSKRGYRRIPMKAPMQETLAAATVMTTGWQGHDHFVNPMCGSATLAIEAALIGLSRAPGLLRNNFGFMHLRGFNESLWKSLRKRARSEALRSIEGRIIATDIDKAAVEASRQNAATAGVEHFIEFGVCDFEETPIPKGKGAIILNPPYGERLGEIGKLETTYRRIGDFFKTRGKGYKGYVFTGNLGLAKKIGLRTRRRIPFFNGEIECRLLEYDLYEGSRRHMDSVERGSDHPIKR